MSLSGNLGFVSLDEVLRLLTRSKQRGSVEVRGEKVQGRIFVDRGGIGLATTFTDEHLHRHLVKSGLVDGEILNAIANGRGDLSGMSEADGGTMTALLREMTVESIYQLGLQGESFEVAEGQGSPYANTKPFELEDLLADSKQRLTDWSDVGSIVSDLDRNLRFRRDLGDRDQVTIAKDAWRVLSEVGQGSSVRTLAEELGTTEFWTARVAAGLIEEDLLAIEEAPPIEEPSTWAQPIAEPVAMHAAEPATVDNDAQAELETLGYQDEMAEVDPNQSWWKEPERGEGDEDEVAGTEPVWADESETVETSEMMAPAATEDTSEVAEDTEAFLEKVFSDMETPDETDEGYGLLRRRRMGVLRDISNE